jgi:hypothetical protein
MFGNDEMKETRVNVEDDGQINKQRKKHEEVDQSNWKSGMRRN